MFLHRLEFWVDPQTVLSQPPGNSRHVGGFPCEDVPVLTEELDERLFLFGVECCRDMSRSSTRVGRLNVNPYCLTGRLKR